MIPYKYQVKPHSSSWFPAASAPTTSLMYSNRITLLYLKLNSDRLVIFGTSKLAFGNKIKETRFPETWLSRLLLYC